jgi:hypothetical protein
MAVQESIGTGARGDAGTARDLARGAANVLGALFQVGAPILSGAQIGQVSDENRTLIVPAGYAFIIWTPIFLLSLGYAVYQALPSHRTAPLLRRVGWWTAAAFVANGLWELAFPARQFVLAQALILGILAGAGTAYVGLVRHARRCDLAGNERWLVGLPIGLLFGWVSAAAITSVLTTLVALGVAAGGPEAAIGAAQSSRSAALAVAAIRFGRTGPRVAVLAYGGAVVWALVAIVVNQNAASSLTAGMAALAALVVAGVLATTLRSATSRLPIASDA